ncbi:flavin-dependent dehydrogenase [Kineococcus xinjiangensis]|uniref:Flavin-dependent dehydrogenase n=1 Tax=Kineococcus xinjiangensis TaxID=512762 RepID=A0A2S6IDZ8_9ACTN|nr:FAD-dependent monooxygenase [Kineococcus xinjiangensis]PPK92416.1 flavin-dependent dehydrogenase [Kineococcus xinjiangensis]
MTDCDVLVVGGGPVGLAAAVEARLAGLSAVVVEPRGTPVDKACGEGLMPGAVAALARLGVHPAGHPIAGFAYADARHRVQHRFRGPAGLGVRRTVLHAALAARAQEVGVEVLRARVGAVEEGLEPGAAQVRAAGVRARWLLACDGLHSTVRGLAGLSRPARGAARFGLRRHYRLSPWTDLVEVHWSHEAEVYVTPVAPDLVGVAVLGRRGALRSARGRGGGGGLEAVVDSVPALAGRLRGAVPDGPVRGAGPLRQRTRARSRGRVLLVGDASGYVDALTGEGLRVGLAQARSAVACLDAGAAPGAVGRAYERAWASGTREARLVTEALVAVATSPARGAVVPAAALAPPLFAGVVERLAR